MRQVKHAPARSDMGHHGPMAGPSPELIGALDPIVGLLRRFLRDLDEDDLPPSLRKVAAATGRKLPPPLLRSLLVEMDRNEWLRGKAAELCSPEDDPVLDAYLSQSPGWWIDAADQAVAAAGSRDAERSMMAEIERLDGQLGEAKRRNADLRASHDTLDAEAKSLRARLRDAGSEPDHERMAELGARVRDLEEQLETERSLRNAAEARIAELLRRRAERGRRSTAPIDGDRSGGMGDAIEVARRLDLDAAALRAAAREVAGTVPAAGGGADPAVPSLPAGILPDSAQAMAWLVALRIPVTVVVDGYNAGYLLAKPDLDARDARRKLLKQLDRFDRLAAVSHRIIVVFDSEEPGPHGAPAGPIGLEVRFATEAPSADDAIVDLVGSLAPPVVVVTNDRELRERVERYDALALWSTALADWATGA